MNLGKPIPHPVKSVIKPVSSNTNPKNRPIISVKVVKNVSINKKKIEIEVEKCGTKDCVKYPYKGA